MLEDPIIFAGILLLTGMWAGAVNSVAGGGTFFSFPILLLMGVPPLLANTTNKFALWFASIAGMAGFVKEIKAQKSRIWIFAFIALIGSITGSLLLLITPAETFQAMVPWLLLIATLLFAGGRYGLGRVRKWSGTEKNTSISSRHSLFWQWLIGVYGGFFAAGMGILMMALYELSGVRSVHEMNGLKTFVAFSINGISALTFLVVGMVDWSIAIYLMCGAIIGGYFGAVLSKKVPELWIRRAIILYGLLMSAYFFATY